MNAGLDPIIASKLRQLGRRRLRLLMLRGLCAGIVTFVVTVSLVAFADWFWLLSDQARWALSGAAYALVVIAVWATSLRRLVHRPATGEFATYVEQSEPELRENLLSAIELATDDPSAVHDSPLFRSLLQGKVAELMGSVRVPRLLPFRLIVRWIVAAGVLIAIAAMLLTSDDARFRQLVTRAVLPGANIARVSRIRIEVLQPTPHSLTLAEDETVAVVVAVTGGVVDEVTLETFTENQGAVRQLMYGRGELEFAANIHVANESVEYRILAGDAITQKFRLKSRPRPRVITFHKTYRYPDYAQLAARTVSEEHGDLIVLQGTTVDMVVELDQEVSEAELRIDQADSEDLQVIPLSPVTTGELVASTAAHGVLWTAEVPVDQASIYKVHLVSRETGFENIYSPKYEIRPQPDLIPRTGFVDQQETTLLLPPNDILALKAMAEDDLPLVSLEQGISVNGGEWEMLPLETEPVGESEGRQVEASWQWDLLNHRLKTGDQVLTKLVATDRMGNTGDSIPLRIVVAAQDFDPDRHAIMQRKASLYDDLADFAELLEEHKASALEVIERMRQAERDAAQTALDRTTLQDLASRQRRQAAELLDKIRAVEREMPPGADAYDLELTGRVIARIQLERASSPAYLLSAMRRVKDPARLKADLDELKRAFERTAEDAKSVAGHYQWLMTHNFLSALASDFDALLKQQRLVVDSPTQTWKRLLRQETIVINQLRVLERLIHDQQTRMPESIVPGLLSLLRWSEDQRIRLEDSMESEDKLAQLRRTSGNLLGQLKQKQRVNSLDGGLPSRLNGIRKDLENRLGTLYVPLNQMARAIQQENRLTAQATLSQDSSESETLQNKARRYSAEVNLKHLPSFGQFRIRRELTQARRDADSQYAADLGLTHRAVQSLLNQRGEVAPAESQIPDHLLDIAPAYRTLEAGHNLIVARDTLNLLLMMERWESQSIDAHIDHPRQWDVVQQTLELASQRLKEASIDRTLVGKLDEVRWSSPVRDANRKITERRWKRDLMVSAGHELVEIRDLLAVVVDDLQPAMAEARTIIAMYAPTIPEIARQTAEQVRKLEESTTDVADLAEKADTREAENQLAELDEQQQSVNQQIEDLYDALVEDANTQNVLDDEQRERARDADDSIALVRAPATRMNRAMQHAQQAEAGEQQAQDLAQAAEHQEKTAQALELVAEHFERLDQGLEVAESRVELRQLERNQGIAQQTDQQFQAAEQLAQMANQESRQLLEELEAELKRNPAMRQALSEIARNTLQDVKNSLESSAQDERNLQQANERADADFQSKKRQLAAGLRELAGQASELSQALVAQANEAAGLGKTKEAQQKFSESQHKLNEAASTAGAARDDQLLSDLTRAADEARAALREATQALSDGKQKTAVGKDDQIHADQKAREAAQKDAENRRKKFFDQQKRAARDQAKRADDTKRRTDRDVRNDENQLRKIKQQLRQAQDNANRKPDNGSLKQAVARKQTQVVVAEKKVAAARERQAEAKQRAETTRKRSDELNSKPMPALDAANPATQLADAYAEDAIKMAKALNQRADQLASESQFGDQLQPAHNQLASAQQQQENITEDVTQGASDVERASRHERRLNNPAAADALQQAAGDIADVARNESTDAEHQLSQATSEAGLAAEAATNNGQSPGNAEALEAQHALAQSEAALAQQAQRLGDVLEPLLAEAETETGMTAGDKALSPASSGNSTEKPPVGDEGKQSTASPSPGSKSAAPGDANAPALTPEQMARGQQLARTLDELDRQQAAAAAANTELAGNAGLDPASRPARPTAAQLESLAQAARTQQAALAAARQQNQQQAVMAMTEGAKQSTAAFSDPSTSSQFELTVVNRDENKDWGKLRDKSADELTRGRPEAVAKEYRKSVEAYFRVLAERARSGK